MNLIQTIGLVLVIIYFAWELHDIKKMLKNKNQNNW